MLRSLSGEPTAPSHSHPALEPYVSRYDISHSQKRPFILPFQIIAGIMVVMAIVAYYLWLVENNSDMAWNIMWVQLALLPLYIPGLYYYAKFFEHDKKTVIEIDHKNGYIQYTNPKLKIHILFHTSQIEDCEVFVSQILPYKINFLRFQLIDGPNLCISSLVAPHEAIVDTFSVPHRVHKRLINPVPQYEHLDMELTSSAS
ncbi:hypothetical protein [Pontibacter sp. G13]|uniref:hypothetical protein n=1 Tax=Pontibacter sp. G13 TaxID=3074898 RepID=UPI00288C1E6C|nr:hypothetical protein [Pontibacter sp. G13]WNJ17646.1 hypothetical protein RJD25_22575 [Pontibacter sp. G13]